MNNLMNRFLDELRERKPICTCGAVAYPKTWMARTREKAIAQGKVYQCGCSQPNDLNLLLKLPPTQP